MRPDDQLFAGVRWKCVKCGKPPGCDCFVKCECGCHHLRGEECNNVAWHAAQTLAADLAERVVADMAESYKLFQGDGYMVGRLKRAVIRQAHESFMATFEGVEAGRRETMETRDSGDTAAADES